VNVPLFSLKILSLFSFSCLICTFSLLFFSSELLLISLRLFCASHNDSSKSPIFFLYSFLIFLVNISISLCFSDNNFASRLCCFDSNDFLSFSMSSLNLPTSESFNDCSLEFFSSSSVSKELIFSLKSCFSSLFFLLLSLSLTSNPFFCFLSSSIVARSSDLGVSTSGESPLIESVASSLLLPSPSSLLSFETFFLVSLSSFSRFAFCLSNLSRFSLLSFSVDSILVLPTFYHYRSTFE